MTDPRPQSKPSDNAFRRTNGGVKLLSLLILKTSFVCFFFKWLAFLYLFCPTSMGQQLTRRSNSQNKGANSCSTVRGECQMACKKSYINWVSSLGCLYDIGLKPTLSKLAQLKSNKSKKNEVI